MSTTAPPRRCRPRRVIPGARRPSDVLAAFCAAALVSFLAAGVSALGDALGEFGWAHWLALHLALLGGVSQLVLGAGQFFVAAFLATDPPSKRLVRAQLGVWNAGTILVAVGVPNGLTPLIDAGAALIAAGLVLFASALLRMERRSLQRARWAVRWYYASAGCLVLGALAGALLARGGVLPSDQLLAAHLALNLAGWLGTAIVGTLHTFFPSLTHTQLRFPRLQGPTFAAWLGGVLALAAGYASTVDPLAAAGWLALATAAALLAANLLASAHGARRELLGLPARLVALGQVFLAAGLLVALLVIALDGVHGPFSAPQRAVLGALVLAGWIALTVSGSLLHLLTVLSRVRQFRRAMPAPQPTRDRLITALAALGVSLLALSRLPALEGLGTAAVVLILAAGTPVAARILALATRLRRPARSGARAG